MNQSTITPSVTRSARLLLTLALLLGLISLAPLPTAHAATAYTVSDDASCTGFLASIGASGEAAGDRCFIYSGTLGADDTLTVSGSYWFRPQGDGSGSGSTNFTNNGTITINSDYGLYNAGVLDNHGSLNINKYSQNYSTINNSGSITIVGQLYNGRTINNSGTIAVACGGSLFGSGTITGNAVRDLCETTAPTANPSQSPAANSAGWNNGDVSVRWWVSPLQAGVDFTWRTVGEGERFSRFSSPFACSARSRGSPRAWRWC